MTLKVKDCLDLLTDQYGVLSRVWFKIKDNKSGNMIAEGNVSDLEDDILDLPMVTQAWENADTVVIWVIV